MIIDLKRFVETERPYWTELEALLNRQEKDALARLSLQEVARFHYLYERVSGSLASIASMPSQQETRRYLESLVARAYGEIHETREKPHRFRPLHWFFVVFPQTFRRHVRAFHLAFAITCAGCLFGGLVVTLDPSSKEIIMPFEQLLGSPSHRVEQEEKATVDRLSGRKAQGAAWYVQHNTTVAIQTMVMGVTWGVGTVILLLSNGIMIGAVMADYILAGQTRFLVGWLLPHGSVEIPAILLAGQAGLVFAGALIGWRTALSLRQRLRAVGRDLVTIIAGVAVFLVWAGIVEAFLSQYHEPTVPYSMKIAFGAVVLVTLFLAYSGRRKS